MEPWAEAPAGLHTPLSAQGQSPGEHDMGCQRLSVGEMAGKGRPQTLFESSTGQTPALGADAGEVGRREWGKCRGWWTAALGLDHLSHSLVVV